MCYDFIKEKRRGRTGRPSRSSSGSNSGTGLLPTAFGLRGLRLLVWTSEGGKMAPGTFLTGSQLGLMLPALCMPRFPEPRETPRHCPWGRFRSL